MRIVIVFLALLVLMFQNCAKQEISSIQKAQKTEFLEENKSVLGTPLSHGSDAAQFSNWETVESEKLATHEYPEYLYAAASGETEGIPLSATAGKAGLNVTVDVSRVCTTYGSRKRTNIVESPSLTINIIDLDSERVVCSSNMTEQIRQEIIQRGTVTVPDCDVAAESRSYTVEMRNAEGKTIISHSTAFDNNVTQERMKLDFDVVGDKLLSNGTIYVLLDYNRKKKKGPQTVPDESCDARNSPLVIDFRKETSEMFRLTAPGDGVLFDLNGSNSPTPYSPTQISWVESNQIAFLTLPDYGRVRGIDQLFGDNTLGPDNRHAKNGFHALFKYDGLQLNYRGIKYGERDLVIDRQDDIFDYLRLWFDTNLDGRAQSDELKTLSELGVEYIDLKYDPRFRERDQFGNEIVYKSIVGMRDGSMKLIFDIWFYVGP